MIDKLLTFQKAIKIYSQEKNKIMINLTKLMTILQNQIEHYDYVKNAKPSQEFLLKFENVQNIVLEKINKRIENEMKDFAALRSEYMSLFNELELSVHSFIRDLKFEATSLPNSDENLQEMFGLLEQTEPKRYKQTAPDKDLNTTKSKPKIKSIPSEKDKAEVDSTMKCIPLGGIYVLREMLMEIMVLENINLIQLMKLNTYEMVKVFSLDEFQKVDAKLKSLDLLLKCFCESIVR